MRSACIQSPMSYAPQLPECTRNGSLREANADVAPCCPCGEQLVLADRADQYRTLYEGCYCFNPGSFASDFSFVAYVPSLREADFSQVPAEELAASLSDAVLETFVTDEQQDDQTPLMQVATDEGEAEGEGDEATSENDEGRGGEAQGDDEHDGSSPAGEQEDNDGDDDDGLSDTERAEQAAKRRGAGKSKHGDDVQQHNDDDDDDDDDQEDDDDGAQERADLDDLDVASGFEDGVLSSESSKQRADLTVLDEAPHGDDETAPDGGADDDEEEIKRRRIR